MDLTVQGSQQANNQLLVDLNNLVAILDAEAKLIDPTPSLLSTANVDKINDVITDILDQLDTLVVATPA